MGRVRKPWWDHKFDSSWDATDMPRYEGRPEPLPSIRWWQHALRPVLIPLASILQLAERGVARWDVRRQK